MMISLKCKISFHVDKLSAGIAGGYDFKYSLSIAFSVVAEVSFSSLFLYDSNQQYSVFINKILVASAQNSRLFPHCLHFLDLKCISGSSIACALWCLYRGVEVVINRDCLLSAC